MNLKLFRHFFAFSFISHFDFSLVSFEYRIYFGEIDTNQKIQDNSE